MVQVFNADSPLNNNINEIIQCTYIVYGIIDTACHTKTSTSNDTTISTTTGTNTYQGVHISTLYTSDTNTGISNTVISTTGTNTYQGIHTSTVCTSNIITGTIICNFPCSCYCYQLLQDEG